MKGLIVYILYSLLALLSSNSIASIYSNSSAQVMSTFYASPDGRGTACTSDNPCSLEGVRNKVRKVNSDMTGDIIVKLNSGTYPRISAFVLDTRDSGSNGFYVIYEAADTSHPPILSGARELTGWTLHNEANNIYKTNVGTARFRQLYVNGTLAIRSRTPNISENTYYGPYYQGSFRLDSTQRVVQVPSAQVDDWERLDEVELVMMPHWYHLRLRIDSLVENDTVALVVPKKPERNRAFNKKESFYNGGSKTFYYFENAYEFLDSEGEWYLNTDSKTVYYKPRANEDIATAKIVVSGSTETLLRISGKAYAPAHHIKIRNIQFEYTTWMQPSITGMAMTQGNQILNRLRSTEGNVVPPPALRIQNAENIQIERNVFSKLGGVGIEFYPGTKNCEVVGNVLYDISSNGIVLDITSDLSTPRSKRLSNVLVANNYITRVGRQYSNGQGILAGFVKNVIIEHNEIADLSYTGIQIGQQSGGNQHVRMGNNLIRYNNIHHVAQLHDDGAGIYTLAQQPGTRIYENWVHHIVKGPWAGSYSFAAIYQDNHSENITVERNVLTNNTRNIYEQTRIGAKNNIYSNNDSEDQAIVDKAGLQPAYADIKAWVPVK